MVTEQTYSVTVTVNDPPTLLLPATLESTDPGLNYDYSLGDPGVDTVSVFFQPTDLRLAFSFELNDDILTEGLEVFVANSSSTQGFPAFLPPLLSFPDTVIRIVDDDSKKGTAPLPRQGRSPPLIALTSASQISTPLEQGVTLPHVS